MAQETLVILFNDEARAFGASHALERLEKRGGLSLMQLAIVVKHPDGNARTVKIENSWRVARTLAGGLFGGLFGALGGPAGVAVGLVVGAVIGSIGHKRSVFDDELGRDVGNALTAGKAAVIAELRDESEQSVDASMAALGGVVFRGTSDQIKAGAEELDAQRTRAKGNRRDDVDPEIDELRVKIEDAIDGRMAKARARNQQRERWIHLLEEEAGQAKTKRADRHDRRIEEL